MWNNNCRTRILLALGTTVRFLYHAFAWGEDMDNKVVCSTAESLVRLLAFIVQYAVFTYQ